MRRSRETRPRVRQAHARQCYLIRGIVSEDARTREGVIRSPRCSPCLLILENGEFLGTRRRNAILVDAHGSSAIPLPPPPPQSFSREIYIYIYSDYLFMRHFYHSRFFIYLSSTKNKRARLCSKKRLAGQSLIRTREHFRFHEVDNSNFSMKINQENGTTMYTVYNFFSYFNIVWQVDIVIKIKELVSAWISQYSTSREFSKYTVLMCILWMYTCMCATSA